MGERYTRREVSEPVRGRGDRTEPEFSNPAYRNVLQIMIMWVRPVDTVATTRNSTLGDVRSTATTRGVDSPTPLATTGTTGGLVTLVAAAVAVLAMALVPVVGVAPAVAPAVCLAVLATLFHRRKRPSSRFVRGS